MVVVCEQSSVYSLIRWIGGFRGLDLMGVAITTFTTFWLNLSLSLLPVQAQTIEGSDGGIASEWGSFSILNYYRFGEDDALSVRVDQFEQHLAELKRLNATVLPLKEALAALTSGSKLPPRSVVITISNAFASTFEQAWPRLRQAGFPFVMIVPTGVLGAPGYMTWEQIAVMTQSGVEVGVFGYRMDNLATIDDEQELIRLLRNSRSQVQERLGVSVPFFAYPYGVASELLLRLVSEQGFVAAMGQHSGVVDQFTNRLYLPRFFLSEKLATPEYFQRVIESRAMGITDINPSDPLQIQSDAAPTIVLSQSEFSPPLDNMQCYHSRQGSVPVGRSTFDERQFVISLPSPFPIGRSRINCLAARENTRYWFGYQYFVR